MMGVPAQVAAELQATAAVELTSATFPPDALMAMLPIASGLARSTVPPAPGASRIRKYWPGCSVNAGRSVNEPLLPRFPVVLAYWTDMPPSGIGALPRLKTSMKSFLSCAPALPPPPYTWLITRSPANAGWQSKNTAVAAIAGRENFRDMGAAISVRTPPRDKRPRGDICRMHRQVAVMT